MSAPYQGKTSHGQSLWREAAKTVQGSLQIDVENDDRRSVLAKILKEASEKQEQAAANRQRWLIRRSNGKCIDLHKLYSRILTVIQRFKAVGDIAVNADPIHAGLPWAFVRALLQVSTLVYSDDLYGFTAEMCYAAAFTSSSIVLQNHVCHYMQHLPKISASAKLSRHQLRH